MRAVPLTECDVCGRPPAAQWGFVHHIVLHESKGVKKLEAGRRAQCRLVLLRTTQPAQVHERGSHVLTAVHEAGQHRPRDVNLGTGKFGEALSGHEVGEVGPH